MKNSHNDSGPYSHLLFEFFVIFLRLVFKTDKLFFSWEQWTWWSFDLIGILNNLLTDSSLIGPWLKNEKSKNKNLK